MTQGLGAHVILLLLSIATLAAAEEVTEGCLPGCQNNGVCKENECICPGGWAGDFCQSKSALTLPPFKVIIGFIVISIASWKIGTFVSAAKLPIITGYLFTGVLAGPFVLNIIPNSAIRRLDFVDEVSLAFIVLAAGGKLAINELKGRGKAMWLNVIILLVLSYALAFGITFAMAASVPFLAEMHGHQVAAVASLIGTIMVARSPASAIAVVQESKAKGPFTNLTLGVTVVMDLVVIVLFSINVLILNAAFEVESESGESSGVLFVKSILRILLSCGVGGLIGKFIVPPAVWGWTGCVRGVTNKTHLKIIDGIQIAIFIFISWAMFVVQQYSEDWLESLLMVMVVGIVLSNYTGRRAEFLHILHSLSSIVFLLFFTITGAALDFSTFASAMGLSVVVFFTRITGLFLSAYFGGRLSGEKPIFNVYAGFTYITQAGVAMGLAKQVHTMFPGWGSNFATTIVTAVVFSQIMGPPLHKWALRRVGEASVGMFAKITGTVVILSDHTSAPLAQMVEGLVCTEGWTVDRVHVPSLAEEGRKIRARTANVQDEEVKTDEVKVEVGEDASSLITPEIDAALRKHFNRSQTSALVMVDEQMSLSLAAWVDKFFSDLKLIVVSRLPGDQGFGLEPTKGLLAKSVAANFKMEKTPTHSKTHNATRTMGMGEGEQRRGKRLPGIDFDFTGDEQQNDHLLPNKTKLVHIGLASAQYIATIVLGAEASRLLDVEPLGHVPHNVGADDEPVADDEVAADDAAPADDDQPVVADEDAPVDEEPVPDDDASAA